MGKKDIKYDQHNYRDHDDRNLSLIKKSIQRCTAGRSILLDKNGEIIAGNATYKTLQELGIPVKIIPTDGKTLIALQRTDLDTHDRKRKELAAFDNSTSDGVRWNVPVFCDIACAIGRRDIDICLHDGQGTIYKRYTERKKPQDLIKKFKLDTPIYAHLCREGLFSGI